MPDRPALDLAFLGSGNAFAPARCWSGFVLNDRYLFDAPPTALYSLNCMGMAVGRIDTVFISHFHADHFFGLPFLLLEYAYETRRESDLTLVGPPGLEQRLHALMELGYPSLLTKDLGFQLRFIEAEHGCEATVNGLRFEAVEVDHGGPAMHSFGYRTELDGRVLAYTGDTEFCEQLVRLGRDADLIVTDCTYATGRSNPEHMSLEEVLELQSRLGDQTSFLLTHLGRDVSAGGLPRLVAAVDQGRYRY